MPDPAVSTVVFPLASRRSNRPTQDPAPAPVAPAPAVDTASPQPKFPPWPALRSVQLDPPVESRWGSAALIFVAGLLVLLLAAVAFALVVGSYGP